MGKQSNSGKKTDGFSISIADVSKLGSDFIKAMGNVAELTKEKERTEQEREKAKSVIHASNNELEKAKLDSQREYERNYAEMIKILTGHEEKCRGMHIDAMIECVKTYRDIITQEVDKKIKTKCLDEIAKLQTAIMSLGDEKLSRTTANWLDSIRGQILGES
ncbi:hypothetical protein [Desulfovibrio sp.]|uniref:hypothetical protein n=1 Tax=Desulfovibrio sp. TaxID=885 RepID=UPI0025C71A3A|nr:hypothetical protein [Desulfovibrio sp.]